MEQLSALDASFLYLETPNSPMHIGGMVIYDQSTVKGGHLRFKEIMSNIEKRLPRSRTFRQKIIRVPMNLDHPYWVEDRDFNLEFHVRHIALPKPGDWRQLCIQVARLHSRPMDLTRPLWEMWVIEGLDNVEGAPKNSFAIYTKLHHAAVDGVSGAEILEALHDLVPYPDDDGLKDGWQGEREPSTLNLLARTAASNIRQPFHLAKVLIDTVPPLAKAGIALQRNELETSGRAPRTRFNSTVSANRVFDGVVLDLKKVREIKNTVEGATVNDVVLAVCGGGLRKYLVSKDELPDESMIAMAPISIRNTDGKGSMGNQVSAMFPPLCTDIHDPVQRFKAAVEGTKNSKELTKAVGAKNLADYQEFLPSAVAGLAARLYSRLGLANRVNPFFNVVVTNVPGPQFPLYSHGATMVHHFGLGPIFDGMGLIMPVFSYNGEIAVSFNSCREMMPDPEFYAQCLTEAFDELYAGIKTSKPKPKRTVKAKTTPKGKAKVKATSAATRKPAARKPTTRKTSAKKPTKSRTPAAKTDVQTEEASNVIPISQRAARRQSRETG